MSDREKLIELLNKAHEAYYKVCDFSKGYMETLADHLLNNGVAFATDTNDGCKWISVEERLPSEEDANPNWFVLAIEKDDGFARSWSWDYVERFPLEFTHWMPMPKPPLDTTNQAADL
jgi:hypothetical protein